MRASEVKGSRISFKVCGIICFRQVRLSGNSWGKVPIYYKTFQPSARSVDPRSDTNVCLYMANCCCTSGTVSAWAWCGMGNWEAFQVLTLVESYRVPGWLHTGALPVNCSIQINHSVNDITRGYAIWQWWESPRFLARASQNQP